MACGISIQLLSDLHLETKEYSSFKIVPAAETLAILGDIGSVNDKPLPDLLRRLVLQFRRVIYVPGNNEFHFSSHVSGHNTTARPAVRYKLTSVVRTLRWKAFGAWSLTSILLG